MCCFSRVTTQLLPQHANQLLSAAPGCGGARPRTEKQQPAGLPLASVTSLLTWRMSFFNWEGITREGKNGFQKGVRWEKDGGKDKENLSLLSQRIQIQALTLPAFVHASCPIHFKGSDHIVKATGKEQLGLPNPAGKEVRGVLLPNHAYTPSLTKWNPRSADPAGLSTLQEKMDVVFDWRSPLSSVMLS